MWSFMKKAGRFAWDHRLGIGTVLSWFVAPHVRKQIERVEDVLTK